MNHKTLSRVASVTLAMIGAVLVSGCKFNTQTPADEPTVRRSAPIRGLGNRVVELTASPDRLEFDDQPAGTASDPLVIEISNTGTEEVQVRSVDLLALGGAFSMSEENCRQAILEPQVGVCTISVVFSPGIAMPLTGQLEVFYGNQGETISLIGTGISGPVEEDPEQDPEEQNLASLSVEPSEALDFGEISSPGDSDPALVVFTNNGQGSAALGELSLSQPGFRIDQAASTCAGVLEVGESCNVSVVFSATDLGPRQSRLELAFDEDRTQGIDLTGTRIASNIAPPGQPAELTASLPELDFGEVVVGAKPSIRFNLKNVGGLAASAIKLLSIGDRYRLINSCTADLAPNGECQIEVVYEPNQPVKRFNRELRITFQDGNSTTPQTLRRNVKAEAYHRLAIGYGPGLNRIRAYKPHNITSGRFDQSATVPGNLMQGTHVTTGDVDGDGIRDTIVAPRSGGGGIVSIYRGIVSGDNLTPTDTFRPYGVTDGGVRVASGDVDGDGKAEIITAPGPGVRCAASFRPGQENAPPPCVIFWKVQGGDVIPMDSRPSANNFAPFDGDAGMLVAVGQLDHTARLEVIVTGTPGGKAHVHAYRYDSPTANWIRIRAFEPTGLGSRSIQVATSDIDGSGVDDIVLASGSDVNPLVKVYDGTQGSSAVLLQFAPYGPTDNGDGGVFVAAIDSNRDGVRDIATGCGPGCDNRVRIFDPTRGSGVVEDPNPLELESIDLLPSVNTLVGFSVGGF